jgi:hypothetical protein
VIVIPRIRPEFTKSSYFVDEPGNWHLKPGAPNQLKEEFETYMASLETEHEAGTFAGNKIQYPYQQDEEPS